MCDSKCDKTGKIEENCDVKNCSCEKRLFGKLFLACEDEMMPLIANLRIKVVWKKYCLIQTVLLINN